MEPANDESNEFSDVQKVLSSKAGNVTFLKKVKFDKNSSKFLAISTNRVFVLAAKSPHRIESSFHILDILSIESAKPSVLQIKLSNEKQGQHTITTDQDDDAHFVIAHLVALLQYNFPGSNRHNSLQLKVEPSDRAEKISRLSEALASSESASEIGPCGGFSLSYSSVCDSYGQLAMAEVMWDVDKIYGSHGCKDFNILDFDHLELKELIPVIATFEYNAWFKSFSCTPYKLSSELVDVIAKVLKGNTSIEDLNLYDCHLQKESLQKLSQAIASNTKTGLKKLNFGKNALEDRGANSFCTALTSLPHGLEALHLKDVNISAKGASAICSALKANKFMSSTLTSLNLSSNPLKADGTSVVCEFLANSNILQELDLSNSECALELVFGAVARGCLQHLKVINLSGNPYSYRKTKETQVAPSVNKYFSSSMVISDVNLSNTKISPETVKAILVGLIANSVAKTVSLDLSRNDLRSSGAAEVSSCVGGLTNITSLDLSDNGLDMDLVTLCQNLQNNKSLKHLNLAQNIGKSRNISISTILESIAEMIMVDTLPLTSLCLADCRLRQDAGIIIDSLGTNETLQELDLSGNFIGDEGARLLAKALQINSELRKIHIDRNGMTLKGFSDIATALERNYSLQLISTPFSDVAPLFKHNSEGVTSCFKKIDQLLLRNQLAENNDQDHSLRLKQNLLLNSIDQESTDYLLVKVQDSIADLKEAEDDDAVAKEVGIGKDSIKDADKMKQVLFKMFVEIGNPTKLVEERATKLTKEMIDFANVLVKDNIHGTLSHLKEQCPSIAANKQTMSSLENLISTKGCVDSLGVKDAITKTVVGQISSKVTDATLQVAAALAEHLTSTMKETLTRSKIKLNFLSLEFQDKQSKEQLKKADSLPSSPVDEKDESSLAAQKAKNRISTQNRNSLLLHDDGGSKGKGVKRRPTFSRIRDQTASELVEVEISLDDAPDDDAKEETTSAKVKTPEPSRKKSEPKSGRKISKGETKTTPVINVTSDTSVNQEDRQRTASLSKTAGKPQVEKNATPSSTGSNEIDVTKTDTSSSEGGLVHLNKSRAKPAKGRRPPSRAAGLTHLLIDPSMTMEDDLPSPDSDEDSVEAKPKQEPLKTPPKPRPKSMQPIDSSTVDREPGVIRSGSIPHKAMLSTKTAMAAKPDVKTDSKPDLKKTPKPPKKEDSVKKRMPMGIPMPGMPAMFRKDKSPSVKKNKEPTDDPKKDTPEQADVADKEAKHEGDDPGKEEVKTEEPVPKPKPKYKPPGGVPFLGGAMGLGGQLMAEMRKKQNIKEPKEIVKSEPEPQEKKSSPKVPRKAAKPAPSVRKPPPPAKLSADKRRSLVLDAGPKPLMFDKPDGANLTENTEEDKPTSPRPNPVEKPKRVSMEPVDAADDTKHDDVVKEISPIVKEPAEVQSEATSTEPEATTSLHSDDVKDVDTSIATEEENVETISANKAEAAEQNNNTEVSEDSNL